jgi:hypothetical protein
VPVNREQIAPKVVQTSEGVNRFKGSLTSEGVSGLRGRIKNSKGVRLQVQMGERSLPRLSRRCHELRKPSRKLRSRRLLGAVCLLRRDHTIQQVLLR